MSLRFAIILTLCCFTLACTSTHTSLTDQSNRYSWVTLAANGQAIARTITDAAACPEIRVDGDMRSMRMRSSDRPDGFTTVSSCEYPIPQGTKQLDINGQPLPLPVSAPKKIAIIGDTGCRMKGSDFQNCNNVSGLGDPWQFKQLADQLAKLQPDLIIHVGDYHYREAPCPEDNAGCANSPYGYQWDSWQVDFFEPAKQLLATAPWIMTRGNHEDCSRAWKGWFYLLDASPISDTIWDSCPEFTPPYGVPFAEFQVINMDSATVPHSFSPPPDPETVQQYSEQYNQINQLASTKTSWLATHRPIWGVSSYVDNGEAQLSAVDFTLRAALQKSTLGTFADNIDLLLAGHIHLYEFLSFDDNRPPLMVVGGSGTELNPPISQSLINNSPAVFSELGLNPNDFSSHAEISYMIFTPRKSGWQATLHGLNGKIASFPLPSHQQQ